jgi:formylglycine-generating enzyme required for sulfatase activity
LICYFSGHGIIDQGELFLLWNDSRQDRLLGTALPIKTIVLAIQRCQARNKLIILDCCHAGAVARSVGFKDATGIPVDEICIKPDNFLVLMAADRLERAREFMELRGSFLTAKLCAALDKSFHEADYDQDGLLSIADLKSFLEAETINFNLSLPDGGKVPTPYFLGQQKGNFFLTEKLSDWKPYEINWPDASEMVVLPMRPERGRAICLAKYPVTNAQYRRFLDANPADPKQLKRYERVLAKSSYLFLDKPMPREFSDPLSTPCQEPAGVHYYGPSIRRLNEQSIGKKLADPLRRRIRRSASWWKGPFYPWRHSDFSQPDQPVLCVNVREAAKYCAWIDQKLAPPGETYLPYTAIWDFAAFGKPFPIHSPDAWLNAVTAMGAAEGPPVVGTGSPVNAHGISNLFQAVWQWCQVSMSIHTQSIMNNLSKLRGGGFMSDLTQEEPYWDSAYLDYYEYTRRSDVGFRIAGSVALELIPEQVASRLLACPTVDVYKIHPTYRG